MGFRGRFREYGMCFKKLILSLLYIKYSLYIQFGGCISLDAACKASKYCVNKTKNQLHAWRMPNLLYK